MENPPPSYKDSFIDLPTPSVQPFLAVINKTETSLESGMKGNANKESLGGSPKHFKEDFQNSFQFLKKANIIAEPVMSQVLAGTSGSQSTKRYYILDQDTRSEIMHGMEIHSHTSELKAFSLHLDNDKELIKCAYIYDRNFSTVEFSDPNGSPIGTFKRGGFSVGLCGCFCLCCCFPLATAALKAPNGEPLALCSAYVFPRKVDLRKPELLGGTFMGSIDLQELNSNATVKASFGDKADFNDKVFLIALAMAMMDYERVRRSKGRHHS